LPAGLLAQAAAGTLVEQQVRSLAANYVAPAWAFSVRAVTEAALGRLASFGSSDGRNPVHGIDTIKA
jgi:hypothetical protein